MRYEAYSLSYTRSTSKERTEVLGHSYDSRRRNLKNPQLVNVAGSDVCHNCSHVFKGTKMDTDHSTYQECSEVTCLRVWKSDEAFQ